MLTVGVIVPAQLSRFYASLTIITVAFAALVAACVMSCSAAILSLI